MQSRHKHFTVIAKKAIKMSKNKQKTVFIPFCYFLQTTTYTWSPQVARQVTMRECLLDIFQKPTGHALAFTTTCSDKQLGH